MALAEIKHTIGKEIEQPPVGAEVSIVGANALTDILNLLTSLEGVLEEDQLPTFDFDNPSHRTLLLNYYSGILSKQKKEPPKFDTTVRSQLDLIRNTLFFPNQTEKIQRAAANDLAGLQTETVKYIQLVQSKLLPYLEESILEQEPTAQQNAEKAEVESSFKEMQVEFAELQENAKVRETLLSRKATILLLIDTYIADYIRVHKDKIRQHEERMDRQTKLTQAKIPTVQDSSLAHESIASRVGLSMRDLANLRHWMARIDSTQIQLLADSELRGGISLIQYPAQASEEKIRQITHQNTLRKEVIEYSTMLTKLLGSETEALWSDQDEQKVGSETDAHQRFKQRAQIGQLVINLCTSEGITTGIQSEDKGRIRTQINASRPESKQVRSRMNANKEVVVQKARSFALQARELHSYDQEIEQHFIVEKWHSLRELLTSKSNPEQKYALHDTLVFLKRVAHKNDASGLEVLLASLIDTDQKYRKVERVGTAQDLYEKHILLKPFFATDKDNTFKGIFTKMYYLSENIATAVNKSFSAKRFDRVLSRFTIVQALQQARELDVEGIGAQRNLLNSLVRDYFFATISVFGWKAENTDHIGELIAGFWPNEIGRQTVEFFKGAKGILTDRIGLPIVSKIENLFLTGGDSVREYASYPIKQDFTPEVLEALQYISPDLVSAVLIHKQLRMMINGRRRDGNPKNIGVYDVPLPSKDKYSVVICNGKVWKKITIPSELVQNELTLESVQLLSKQIADQSGYIPIPYEQLKRKAHEAYTSVQKYQDIEPLINDPNCMFASDIRITLTQDNQLTELEQWQNNLLANTYQGATQLAFFLGLNEEKQVTTCAVNACHRNVDGLELKKQNKIVFRETIIDSMRLAKEVLNVGEDEFVETKQINDFLLPAAINCREVIRTYPGQAFADWPNEESVIETQSKSITVELTQNLLLLSLKNQIDEQRIPPAQVNSFLIEKLTKLIDSEINYLATAGAKNKIASQPTPSKLPKETVEAEFYSKYFEAELLETELALREQSDVIFSFYNEKFGAVIDRNVILQVAIMMTMDMEHSHFLESDGGQLAPAICVLSKDLQETIKDPTQYVLNPDKIIEVLFQQQIMKMNRESIKSKNFDIVRTMAVLTGLHTSSFAQREVIAWVAQFLNPDIANPSSDTILVSSISERRPARADGYSLQTSFGTALNQVYMNNGAFGVSDRGVDTHISLRCLKNKNKMGFKTHQEFSQALKRNLKAILQFFNHGMDLFIDTPSLEEMGRTPWIQQFKSPAYDQQLLVETPQQQQA